MALNNPTKKTWSYGPVTHTPLKYFALCRHFSLQVYDFLFYSRSFSSDIRLFKVDLGSRICHQKITSARDAAVKKFYHKAVGVLLPASASLRKLLSRGTKNTNIMKGAHQHNRVQEKDVSFLTLCEYTFYLVVI